MRRLILLSAAALISFLVVSARSDRSTATDRFSDREIFEGVVFGVGPVATLVPEAREQLRPEIYARSADDLASMAAVRTNLIASIERAQPDLVAEFARVARSGDPAAIRAMLERATESVNAAADEVQADGLNGSMLANMPLPDRPDRMRPAPPRPTQQLQQAPGQLIANMPLPDRPDRMRPAPPRPTQQLTSPQLAAQPAWALFGSRLFTEQLAASMAVKLESSSPAEG